MDQFESEITPKRDQFVQEATVVVSGHFGELLQGRLGPDGPVVLVSLRCADLRTSVEYTAAPGHLSIDATPNGKMCNVATALLNRCDGAARGGRLVVHRAADPGHGLGSSTADLLGTIRAVSQVHGLDLTPDEEALLCLDAEGAVDPLMYDDTVLFASRQGRVIKYLPKLPDFRIVGILAGPPRDTNPKDTAFPDISDLSRTLENALTCGDLARVGAVSTRSAEQNQARNPNPAWPDMQMFAEQFDAAGVVTAHTGSAIGLLLPAKTTLEPVAEAVSSLGFGRALCL